MRQSVCTMHDANRSALLFTAKLPIWRKKDESNALDDSTRRSCNLSARASESTRAAVHRKLDHGAMQVDRWPISALPGERLGARRPTYATIGRPGLRAGKNMGLRRQWSLGRSWLPRRVPCMDRRPPKRQIDGGALLITKRDPENLPGRRIHQKCHSRATVQRIALHPELDLGIR
jgi:hypothetical protein